MRVLQMNEHNLLSDKIKYILKRKKWTQLRMSQEIGISAPRLNKYYHDRNNPVADWVVEAINELYNKTLNEDKLIKEFE